MSKISMAGSDPSSPQASVIIPVYNDAVALRACLAALESQATGADFEVIVVDNGSDVPVCGVVAAFPRARCVAEAKPGSYSARNAGIRVARGRILAFTDADCVPSPGWLEAAVRHLDGHPETGVVGGPVVLTTGERPTPSELYEKLFAFPQEDFLARLQFSVTANMAVRTDVMRNVGVFDESLLSGGDMEWGQRAARAGFAPAYVADMVISHRARATLPALARKHRRMAGGHIAAERNARGWFRAMLLAIKPAFPMRRAFRLLPNYRRHGLSGGQALAAAAILIGLALVSQAERLRVLLGGSPTRA